MIEYVLDFGLDSQKREIETLARNDRTQEAKGLSFFDGGGKADVLSLVRTPKRRKRCEVSALRLFSS